jgi:hypothetical protein
MTIYAHIEDGTITGRYDLLPTNWRNISNFYTLEGEDEYLHSLGWRKIIKDTTEFDSSRYRQGEATYSIVDDTVVESIPLIEIIDNSENDRIANHIKSLETLRAKRDKLLSDTDFTQLNDVIALNGSEVTQAYITYRQELRDLPTSYENDPNFTDERTVVYPTLQLPQG